MTKILYDSFLLLDRFRFCETHFTTYQRFVADRSAISPFLGGNMNVFKNEWERTLAWVMVALEVCQISISISIIRVFQWLHMCSMASKNTCNVWIKIEVENCACTGRGSTLIMYQVPISISTICVLHSYGLPKIEVENGACTGHGSYFDLYIKYICCQSCNTYVINVIHI